MSATPVLLLDDAPRLCERVAAVLEKRGVGFEHAPLAGFADPSAKQARGVALLVLDPHETLPHADQVLAALEQLTAAGVPAVVWGMPPEAGAPRGDFLDVVAADASLEEVVARLAVLGRYAPLVRQLEGELETLQRITNQMQHYFQEIDQELRLAGRLQQDFLPARLPHVPPLTFSTLYRPATWVSGDMYDAFRIDEQWVGMFLTDAMGHGIAAGLLTMFLRQALVAKRIAGRKYQIVSPPEAIQNLNDCLVRQQLPNCQFVTAAYGIINTETLELRVARGGHPHPLRITARGEIRELPAPGGLLGVPGLPADFGESRVRLDPGDKVIFYSDGIQDHFIDPERSGPTQTVFTAELQEWARLEGRQMVAAMSKFLDNAEGSLHPADDVTVLVAEITG
jgi:sigma-B regulation protein RsbU (phosphoserine phosphatase)